MALLLAGVSANITSRDMAASAVVQSAESEPRPDLPLIAAANGWTAEEAAAYYRAEQAVGQVAGLVAAERPDVFVGSALSPQPHGTPILYIKGPADKEIRGLADSGDVAIGVVDEQPFSFDELEERKRQVHGALRSAGYREVVTAVDITAAGAMTTTVRRQRGLPDTVQGLIAFIPTSLRSSVAVTITDEPVVMPAGAFGGMKLQDDGVFECTSGWTVLDVTDGTRGISGAGHCVGNNQINHPGHGVHPVFFQGQHEGVWGDVEWHTTNENEADDFYADATTIRDVAVHEPRGQYLCW